MPLPRVAQATVLADASHFCNNVALTETKPVLVLSEVKISSPSTTQGGQPCKQQNSAQGGPPCAS